MATPANVAEADDPPVIDRRALAGLAHHPALVVPTYDRASLAGGIVHLGVGGFHRSHLAVYLDDLLGTGRTSTSIVGAGLLASDARLAAALTRQDGLYVLIERDRDATTGRVIGSIGEYLLAAEDSSALISRMADPATQIVSLTITEGGYPLVEGEFVETAQLRTDATSDQPHSAFGIIARALELRHHAGLDPFTVMSCDNLPGNGDVARAAVLGAATMRASALAEWIAASGAFPNAMVDRITPATTDADRAEVRARFGVVDDWPVVCEPFRQWALEDVFSAGRPPFEEAGALMTTDIAPYEHMKLRLLNASHSGLAYHAALAGIVFVHDAMAEPPITRFMRALMRDEAAPNLVSPAGIDLADYQDALVHRFANPAIGDQIARLCLDGSSKFPTFIVPSIEAQLRRGAPVRMLGLVLAGWCRYLRGVGDDGRPITLSADPFLDEAVAAAAASRTDPVAFLRYRRALGPNIADSADLLATFTDALDSLERVGSLATLDAWTS